MSPRAALDYSRLSVMILLSVIFYNEFLVYFNTYRSWPELEQKRMLKILFVADPVSFFMLKSMVETMSEFSKFITNKDS